MKIEWTRPALLDLESIRDYISRDSESYATRFIEKIIEAVESLERFPKLIDLSQKPKRKILGNYC